MFFCFFPVTSDVLWKGKFQGSYLICIFVKKGSYSTALKLMLLLFHSFEI